MYFPIPFTAVVSSCPPGRARVYAARPWADESWRQGRGLRATRGGSCVRITLRASVVVQTPTCRSVQQLRDTSPRCTACSLPFNPNGEPSF